MGHRCEQLVLLLGHDGYGFRGLDDCTIYDGCVAAGLLVNLLILVIFKTGLAVLFSLGVVRYLRYDLQSSGALRTYEHTLACSRSCYSPASMLLEGSPMKAMTALWGRHHYAPPIEQRRGWQPAYSSSLYISQNEPFKPKWDLNGQ